VSDRRPLELSRQALFRYRVVSHVLARASAGLDTAAAIREILALAQHDPLLDRAVRLSERSVYRWLRAFDEHGLAGLEPDPRRRTRDSQVLSPRLLDFLRQQKCEDPPASLPELIERARLHGVLGDDEPVSRTSVWRACSRMGLPVRRLRRAAERDMRRFAYAHRMLMVLADGKHFRAGPERRRRVALTLLDDATRFGLAVAVDTSENTELFLRTLHHSLLRHGWMQALFLDRGPGFISDDTVAVLARLGIHLIHGTAAYPEGHGKIERFHRTFWERELRGLDGHPGVDPDPAALTLRLAHWLEHVYNHQPHEALGGHKPVERFTADSRPLEFPPSREALEACFLITHRRRVSSDNVLSYDGVAYEVPRGHAGCRITVTRHLLQHNRLSILHEGRVVLLHPVDLEANAYARRARLDPRTPEPAAPPTTAAHRAFQADFDPIVGPDGSYPKGDDDDA
jgi:transposase InsO family protein